MHGDPATEWAHVVVAGGQLLQMILVYLEMVSLLYTTQVSDAIAAKVTVQFALCGLLIDLTYWRLGNMTTHRNLRPPAVCPK